MVAERLVGNVPGDIRCHDLPSLSYELEHVIENPIPIATSRRNTLLDTNRNVF
jgi:hypothetical protein